MSGKIGVIFTHCRIRYRQAIQKEVIVNSIMSCDILDEARTTLASRKVKCGDVCKTTRRCPFIHGELADKVFPKPPVPEAVNGSVTVYTAEAVLLQPTEVGA